MNKVPNFIIIGAGKCGTTSLFSYLKQHPQIYLCPQKETFFFVDPIVKEKLKAWKAVINLDNYYALFKDAPEGSTIGEISTVYYASPKSAQLIYELIPTVKIIAILRDPAERAFSDYQMHISNGREKKDFSTLISKDNGYVKKGFYYAELITYFNLFKKEQIKILLYDDFCKNPTAFAQELFRFIEVDDTFIPEMSTKARQGGVPKNPTLHKLLSQPNSIRASFASVLKLFLPEKTRQKLRNKLIKKNIQKANLSPETRKRLIDLYRSDILELQKLIERDLSAWLR